MASFKIHRLKENAAAQFRWAPHTSGAAVVKMKDYELGTEEIEAASAYALFNGLRDGAGALQVGDVLELPDGTLRIFKFVGLEEAAWWVPPVKGDNPPVSGAVLEAEASAAGTSA
jgi:hypothetical protein